ncbi:hypothetical protein BC830DRAFT_1078482 [Chytriomyces sp. MP71]|nr:hypothetical protein BC830DRAFT_1078482 [Chytriomyces sp. MP71]
MSLPAFVVPATSGFVWAGCRTASWHALGRIFIIDQTEDRPIPELCLAECQNAAGLSFAHIRGATAEELSAAGVTSGFRSCMHIELRWQYTLWIRPIGFTRGFSASGRVYFLAFGWMSRNKRNFGWDSTLYHQGFHGSSVGLIGLPCGASDAFSMYAASRFAIAPPPLPRRSVTTSAVMEPAITTTTAQEPEISGTTESEYEPSLSTSDFLASGTSGTVRVTGTARASERAHFAPITIPPPPVIIISMPTISSNILVGGPVSTTLASIVPNSIFPSASIMAPTSSHSSKALFPTGSVSFFLPTVASSPSTTIPGRPSVGASPSTVPSRGQSPPAPSPSGPRAVPTVSRSATGAEEMSGLIQNPSITSRTGEGRSIQNSVTISPTSSVGSGKTNNSLESIKTERIQSKVSFFDDGDDPVISTAATTSKYSPVPPVVALTSPNQPSPNALVKPNSSNMAAMLGGTVGVILVAMLLVANFVSLSLRRGPGRQDEGDGDGHALIANNHVYHSRQELRDSRGNSLALIDLNPFTSVSDPSIPRLIGLDSYVAKNGKGRGSWQHSLGRIKGNRVSNATAGSKYHTFGGAESHRGAMNAVVLSEMTQPPLPAVLSFQSMQSRIRGLMVRTSDTSLDSLDSSFAPAVENGALKRADSSLYMDIFLENETMETSLHHSALKLTNHIL